MAVSFFGKVIIPFLAYFLVEVTGEQQYGGLGGEITLTPKVSGQPEDILWKHIGNKVVEFDGSQNVEYGRYKGRTILNWGSGALTIKGLTDADSGPYELETVIKGKLQYSHHEVDVIDDVAQPSISCVVNNTTPENMDRTLLCSADLQPLTQFIWRIPEGSESPGPELFIPGVENQDSENQESVYTCVVKNPVSERTAEFTLKDCHTEEGSTSVLAVVLSILLLLVLVAVLAFLLWYWRKGKKPAEAALRTSEEEAGLMEVTVQGNKDPEDDHSENTGNRTSTPKGMVKEGIEFSKQNADANRKQHTAPAGIIFSPTKSGGHSPLYRQNDSLSDRQTVTDTEPVQDKPNPAHPKLVTPDPTQAQQGLVSQTGANEEKDSQTGDGEKDSQTGDGEKKNSQTGAKEEKDSQTVAKEEKDSQTGAKEEKDSQTGAKEEKDSQTGAGEKEKDSQTGAGEKEKDSQTGAGEKEKDCQTGAGDKENDSQTGAGDKENDSQTGAGEKVKDSQTGAGEKENDSQTGAGEKEKDSQTGAGEKQKDSQTEAGEKEKDSQTGAGEKEKDSQTEAGEKEKDSQTGAGEKEKDSQTGA